MQVYNKDQNVKEALNNQDIVSDDFTDDSKPQQNQNQVKNGGKEVLNNQTWSY